MHRHPQSVSLWLGTDRQPSRGATYLQTVKQMAGKWVDGQRSKESSSQTDRKTDGQLIGRQTDGQDDKWDAANHRSGSWGTEKRDFLLFFLKVRLGQIKTRIIFYDANVRRAAHDHTWVNEPWLISDPQSIAQLRGSEMLWTLSIDKVFKAKRAHFFISTFLNVFYAFPWFISLFLEFLFFQF